MPKRKTTTSSRARKATRTPPQPPTPDGEPPWLSVVGARQNNLHNVNVDIPLCRFVCVTGVSGSGKSSLVNDILWQTLARDVNGATKVSPGTHDRIDGLEHLDKVINIDQSPIGRTPRSNPATYIKVFDEIRMLYARLSDAKLRGYQPGRFSFNVHTGAAGGGRCEACEGNGQNKMEMDFLADVWVTCPVCAGRRFNLETRQIAFKGKNISQVLEMDVQQALTHFANIAKIARPLETLHDVGLDYLKLGQSSTTLSGGEAQRIKLAKELVKRSTGRTLYLLDEPTTGLHFDDIKKLLAVLHQLVDLGNTVLVIEHNLDVIKTADWVIDLGPEGGEAGGRIVAAGTPEKVARSTRSYTGQALREVLYAKQDKAHAGTFDRGTGRRSGMKPAARTPRARGAITVRGAAQHNLKGIDVEIPRGSMTVCCGPSGSGKSSLAIDTIYTEGQRRYVESLSAYARQFLSRLQPPRVDHIDGLSPAVCIEQKSGSKSPRSTVGTVTEIYDYMRVLWARIGKPYCPRCDAPVRARTVDEIVEQILSLGAGRRVLLMATIEPGAQESFTRFFQRYRADGFARVCIDGVVHSLDDGESIHAKRRQKIRLVVDRITLRKKQAGRVADSVEQCLALGDGVMLAGVVGLQGRGAGATAPIEEHRYSQHPACESCGERFEGLTPHHFSFNTRMGWCQECEGLGVQRGASASAIVVHPTRSIADGAVGAWGELKSGSKLAELVGSLALHIGFDLHTPWNELEDAQRLRILHGCSKDWIEVSSGNRSSKLVGMRFQWHGFYPAINRATRSSWQYRKRLEDLVTEVPCEACAGGRLKAEPSAVRVGGVTIHEACLWPLSRALSWFEEIKLSPRDRKIAGELLHEISSRLRFLVDVGLDYVGLHRRSSSLSGGESQRIQLASQIGTGLVGVLYVLDEPTIGLHPRDNDRLIKTLHRLRDLGNTLLVVEHDREVIDAADHVLDFGPGAGAFGGELTAADPPQRIRRRRKSLTGAYLSGEKAIVVPSNRRPVDDRVPKLVVRGARENNLKEIDVAFPLGRLTCVTGVSGSGKSTLVSDILYKALAARIHRARTVPGGHDRIEGLEYIDKVINVDHTPIGNSPTSNPATYTGAFDTIRELYARLPLSKVRGYTINRFSFNRPGGRCEVCEGMGQRCIEMHFLPDVWVVCESCGGARYVTETLEVHYRGKSIADVLEMRIAEAAVLFESIPKVRRMLDMLEDVGLGYLQLGQSAPTLSGGEAQRVKLAAELGRPSTGKTLYILDEPTTGLHFDDLNKLLTVLHRLVDLGNTCICVEHHLDMIKNADWVIDLGPEAGDAGGEIVAEGTPEEVASCEESHTGKVLLPVLRAGPTQLRTETTQRDTVPPLRLPDWVETVDDVQMPWERDGRTWHTLNHLDSKGEPVEWDPQVLDWLVDVMEGLGSFAPVDWKHRTRVEIKAPKVKPWYCHFLTGGKDLLECAIRVPQGTLKRSKLKQTLKIKTLDERTDLPIYGQWDRLRFRNATHGWEECRLYLRDFKDVNKAALRRFLKLTVSAYFSALQSEAEDPSIAEPWRTDGQGWHLSQKSISRGQTVQWKPSLLMVLIGRLKSMQPDLTFSWSSKTSVQFSLLGGEEPLGKIVTNVARGLRVELRAPAGKLVPTQVERLGEEPEIKRHQRYDRIVFWMNSLGQNDSKQFREVWRRCRQADSTRRQTA